MFDNIVFMKFGYHAQEGEHDIIKRKKTEFETAGKMFWGYGGVICHPVSQIQPFVRNLNEKKLKVFLVMSFTPSKPLMEGAIAKKYSVDGINWLKIPDGITVKGSKFAIICSELITTNKQIDLYDYNVAIGPSSGKNANDYIKYRVDKGCLVKNNELHRQVIANIKNIELYTEIVYPYAVLVR